MLDQVLWFVTRGTGAVSLLMLTASACLGLVTITRAFTPWMLGVDVVSVAAVAPSLAWRILPRGTIARTGSPTRLGSGNGG
jgi:hypothetical protein